MATLGRICFALCAAISFACADSFLSSVALASIDTCDSIGTGNEIYGFTAKCGTYFAASGSSPFKYEKEHTFASCAALCASEDQCTNFHTYTYQGKTDCRLYSSLRGLITYNDAKYASGLAVQPKIYNDTCDSISTGNEIYGFAAKCGTYFSASGSSPFKYAKGHTFASCAALCASEDQCTNFHSYTFQDQTDCRLYSSIRGLTVYNDAKYASGFAKQPKIYNDACDSVGTGNEIYGFTAKCGTYFAASGSSSFKYAKGHTFASCAALCASEDQCTNFHTYTFQDQTDCRLYSSIRGLTVYNDAKYASGFAKQPKTYNDTCDSVGTGNVIYGLTARCDTYFTGAGNPYASPAGHSFTSCAALCASSETCAGFDWMPSGTPSGTNPIVGYCRQFASTAGASLTPQKNYASGQKQASGSVYRTCQDVGDGGNLAGFTARCSQSLEGKYYGTSAGQTFVQCAELCQKDYDCANFAFRRASAQAELGDCFYYYAGHDRDVRADASYDVGLALDQKPKYKTCIDVGNGTAIAGATAYCGYSLEGSPFRTDSAATYPICANMCQMDSDCINFSYRTADKQCMRYNAGQGAYLKENSEYDSGVAPYQKPTYKECLDFGSGATVATFTIHCGFALQGRPYQNTLLETFPLCAEACEADMDCANFDYQRETKACRRFYPGQGTASQANVAYDLGIGTGKKASYRTCEDFGSGTVVAGYTAWCGVIFKGASYKSVVAASFPLCAETCRKDTQCVNLAYQYSANSCRLYSAAADTEVQPNADYAVGLGGAPSLTMTTTTTTTTTTAVPSTTASCSCTVTEYF